jgi:hypothetical protein
MTDIQGEREQQRLDKGCLGKVRHHTRRDAMQVKKNMIKKDKKHKRLAVYKCGFCEYYHLGHDKFKFKQR